jgi:hypothetical protein
MVSYDKAVGVVKVPMTQEKVAKYWHNLCWRAMVLQKK